MVRGPSALLYGSGALGGVIAYDTVDAKDLLEPGKTAAIGCSLPVRRAITASAWGQRLWPHRYRTGCSRSSRDRGDLRQSDGTTAPNDESIQNMLAKGSWKIDAAQSLSGSLRYYNNAAQEPKTRKPVQQTAAVTR